MASQSSFPLALTPDKPTRPDSNVRLHSTAAQQLPVYLVSSPRNKTSAQITPIFQRTPQTQQVLISSKVRSRSFTEHSSIKNEE